MRNLIFAVLLASAAFARSQSPVASPLEKIPLGNGPILKRAPESSTWTITYNQPASPKGTGGSTRPAPGQIQKVTVTKEKTVYREEKQFSDGSKREGWYVGNFQITTLRGKMVLLQPGDYDLTPDPDLFTDYSTSDFPNLQWLSKDNFKGVQKIGDVEYLVFEGHSTVSVVGFSRSGAVQIIAEPLPFLTEVFIDREARLPAWSRAQGLTVTYTYGPPPENILGLPPEVRDLLQQREKMVKTLLQRNPSH